MCVCVCVCVFFQISSSSSSSSSSWYGVSAPPPPSPLQSLPARPPLSLHVSGMCKELAAYCLALRSTSPAPVVFVEGPSGSGKTQGVYAHFPSLKVHRSNVSESFSLEGLDIAWHSVIFLDEFNATHVPRSQLLTLLDRRQTKMMGKYVAAQDMRFLGPIMLAAVRGPTKKEDAELWQRVSHHVRLSHNVFECRGACVMTCDHTRSQPPPPSSPPPPPPPAGILYMHAKGRRALRTPVSVSRQRTVDEDGGASDASLWMPTIRTHPYDE